MASTGGRTRAALIDALFRESYRFEFFQAVRLLEQAAHERARENSQSRQQPVGMDGPPAREVVRFVAHPSLSFPSGSISQLRPAVPAEAGGAATPPQMQVTFMGLTGPQGVLPQHYTSLLIERSHVKHKDFTLRDFFDLFNHRTVSLFYRAWEKYRFPFAYERFQRQSAGDDDLFTFCLYCLTGIGTRGLHDRMEVDDEAILYYGGHFAHYPRCAISLEQMLSDYFDLPVTVDQFQGQWLYLSEENQSSFPTPRRPEGLNLQLGENVIVGERVWEVQSKFRVVVGPVKYRDFLRFIPVGDALRPVSELTRHYVGQELDFDVQVLLLAAEVPACQLDAASTAPPRLGWNTWLQSQPRAEDARDAVFELAGV